ncbi:MAG: glycosyl hydrolase 53 family protein [Oscillospiraceae bacterium]|nr:glycosyl hydrolase 53 family protein [Oscillospiraceae bacterium]
MKKLVLILLLALPALLLCACGSAAPAEEAVDSSLYVKPVELPEGFILGMDVSSLIAEEQSGVRYYDFDGQERDLLQILADSGVTHIRVRVWNHPYDEQGRGYGGGNCDAEKAAELGKRAAAAGLKLIVDFHYSDFWADPGKQKAPLAWQDMDIETKSQALYEFTCGSLKRIKDAGAEIAMVQIGNETNGALCGETKWHEIRMLMSAGSRAVRELCPDALVAVHFANPENSEAMLDYAYRMSIGVDYDVFASSYYPFWHGTLENLASVLRQIAETYGKKVMVMETSYAYTGADTDFFGNSIGDESAGIVKNYPFTVQGQANSVHDVIETVAGLPDGLGVVYWEGAWISVGTESWETNHALWEQFGSGWASSYASAYDPDDAGKWYGGSSWDNQAFFDPQGRPLESLRLFKLLRAGNSPEVVPDAIEDAALRFDLTETIALPETVNAVMTDGSRRAVPVVWDVTEAELAAMQSGGAKVYEIRGTAGGMEARGTLTMAALNYLENPGFESGDLSGWTLTERGQADQLYVEDKLADSLEGTWHFHFWSAKKDSVDFSLEQSRDDLKSGTYAFSISIMGGDGGEQEIFAYVKLDGETVATAPLRIGSWNEWDTAELSGIEVAEGQTLTVGVSVKCGGAGSGAWGKIDGAALTRED